MIRSRKVLDSARGQTCTARFPGICIGGTETTVWAHLNGAAFGKGAALKAHDVLGFHACMACHSYYDVGHGTKAWLSNDDMLESLLRAVCDTWVRLITAGIIVVPMDAEKLFNDRPVKPRKPPAERRPPPTGKPLQSRSEFPKGRKIATRPIRRDA